MRRSGDLATTAREYARRAAGAFGAFSSKHVYVVRIISPHRGVRSHQEPPGNRFQSI